MGRRGMMVGWVVAKAKTKKQDDTMVEFRVAMRYTCTHRGPWIYMVRKKHSGEVDQLILASGGSEHA